MCAVGCMLDISSLHLGLLLHAGSALQCMAWDCAERLALAVQTAAGPCVLLYATQLRPMMTAQLLGTVACSGLAEAERLSLGMHGSSHGAVLAVAQTGRNTSLVPLLYKE